MTTFRLAGDEEDGAEAAARPQVPWWRITGFLLKLTLRHPWMLTLSILASVGVALSSVVSLGLVFPFVASLTGGALQVPADFPLAFFTPYFEGMRVAAKVRTIAGLLLAVQVFRGLLSYAESRLTAYMRILIEQDLREDVFDEIMRVELRYVQSERTANLFTILNTYPRQVGTLVDQYLGALTKSISGATYIVLLAALSWQLTLIAGALALLSMLAVRQINRAVRRLSQAINESRVRLHQTSLESLQGLKLVRMFAREDHARARYSRDLRTMRRQSFRRGNLTAAMPQVHAVLNMLLFAALIFAATLLLDVSDPAWLLTLTMFIFIVSRLTGPMTSLTRKQAKITEDLPAVEELMAFFGAKRPVLADGKRRFEALREGVRFEDVSYAYGEKQVLRGVSLEIPRGKKVALVGPSGSGKSTVLALLSRLSDPTSGRVLADGVDLREYEARTWRTRVAVVSQDMFLFDDTVRANILYGRPDATDEEIERAARVAGAHEFILALPEGYDTTVGDRGARLSGGQAQRIAIARAVLADPEILVLDEATSALDTDTERVVQDAIDAASRDRTVIAVAHRLATIRDADHIYVLEEGRVVEEGTHDELVARGGAYRHLVEMQDLKGDVQPRAPAAPAAAADPIRVVFLDGGREARVANGGAHAEDVVVVAVADRGEAVRKARASAEPVVVVYPGAEAGVVRLSGGDVREAPLFEKREGAEQRVRVRRITAP